MSNQNRREADLKRKYRITVEDYDRMLTLQGGGCCICGSTPKKRRLSVDHNHRTGRVRGLLCFPCNYGIGWLKDNAIKAKRIANYIKRDGRKPKRNYENGIDSNCSFLRVPTSLLDRRA